MKRISDKSLLEQLLARVDFPQRSGFGRVSAPAAKFTNTQIRAIRKMEGIVSNKILAEALGVDQTCVWRIMKRKVYSNVR